MHPAPPVLPPRTTAPRLGAGRARWLGWVVALGAVAALGVLRLQEPAGQVYYPRCWLYMATGLQCPGCGVLRSTHALLNGRWEVAWRLNPTWVALLPWLAWGGVASALRARGVAAWQPWARPWFLGAVMGVLVAHAVARNVTWP